MPVVNSGNRKYRKVLEGSMLILLVGIFYEGIKGSNFF